MKTWQIVPAVLLGLLISYAGWIWFFCRFYVPPGNMAIIIAKSGEPLPAGQILAGPNQKGIREEVLGEGRYFRNPILYGWEIRPVTTIPPGRLGLVTAKVGSDLPAGKFLAGRGEKGIWRQVLGPGTYRMNPYGYAITLVDAISVPIGYVGVLTSLSGEQVPSGQFAGPGQKGIREDILQPGLYFINPKEFNTDVLEVGVNQVSLLGKRGGQVITKGQMASANAPIQALQSKVLVEQAERRLEYYGGRASSSTIAPAASAPGGAQHVGLLTLDQQVEFPSRDGFSISLDMTVEFELLPSNIAAVFNAYGDLPAVVEKIIMPQILSVSRLKGSAYRAKDFIVGEGREAFQEDLKASLAGTLSEKRIIVHNALIRQVNVPAQILDPIQQASIAVEQDLTNKEKQNTARRLAELNTEQALIKQRGEQVAQETEKMKAEIRADQEKRVAEIRAEAERRVAEIEQQTASVRAERRRKLGNADARVIELVEGEKAAGLEMQLRAFADPAGFSLLGFAESLNPEIDIQVLHAGEGTLWTDLGRYGLGPTNALIEGRQGNR